MNDRPEGKSSEQQGALSAQTGEDPVYFFGRGGVGGGGGLTPVGGEGFTPFLSPSRSGA